MTNKICCKLFEEHVVDGKKTLLFKSQEKKRSTNPVFMEHQC